MTDHLALRYRRISSSFGIRESGRKRIIDASVNFASILSATSGTSDSTSTDQRKNESANGIISAIKNRNELKSAANPESLSVVRDFHFQSILSSILPYILNAFIIRMKIYFTIGYCKQSYSCP